MGNGGGPATPTLYEIDSIFAVSFKKKPCGSLTDNLVPNYQNDLSILVILFPCTPGNGIHLRWFPEEVVLAEDGDEEANKAFDCHGNKSSSHNIPFKWRLNLVKLS